MAMILEPLSIPLSPSSSGVTPSQGRKNQDLTADYADDSDGKLGLEIRDIVFAYVAHDTLPIQTSIFELEQKRKLQANARS